MKNIGLIVVALGFLVISGQAPPPPDPINLDRKPAPRSPFSIAGNTTVNEHELVHLSLAGGDATVAWLVMPNASEFTAGRDLVFTGSPGNYTVVCLAVSGSAPIIMRTAVQIVSHPTALDPVSKGDSTPTRIQQRIPTPVGAVWALLVFDKAKRSSLSVRQGMILDSHTIDGAIESAGAYWKPYEVHATIPAREGMVPLASTKWGKSALETGLPALVVIDSMGTIILSVPLPPDEKETVSTVKNVMGKRSS
jgi:hypothetical protein